MLENLELFDRATTNSTPMLSTTSRNRPGVSYSIENPRSRIESNVVGALNLLELQKGYVPAIWAETQLF